MCGQYSQAPLVVAGQLGWLQQVLGMDDEQQVRALCAGAGLQVLIDDG